MRIERFYHRRTPELLQKLCETPQMQRLRQVGMNCGCEYTAFRRFRKLRNYSRFDHSLGTARIVWHFTADPVQSTAALFHDIATPTFAHSVDFLRGDHLKQEATEAATKRVIRDADEIAVILKAYGIPVEAVLDYHRYPIADNDAPRLSADRLEYTFGNLENYRLRPITALKLYYHALCVAQNESGEEELAFSDAASAIDFGFDALRCSRIYVADEDRYAMQMLAELLDRALRRKILSEEDLMGTEAALIEKLQTDPEAAAEWSSFRAMKRMICEEELAPAELRRVVPAKKRCIDPFVRDKGRLSQICEPFADALREFREQDQSHWLCAK